MLGEMDEQVILGNFVDELYYKQCNHEESDINHDHPSWCATRQEDNEK